MRIHTFAEQAAWEQNPVPLGAEASRHLSRVLRVRPGQSVTLFDGTGRCAKAEVVQSAPQQVSVKILCQWELPPPKTEITLIQALPKGAKLDLILQKAVELGCSRIIPLQSARCVTRVDETDAMKKKKRWERIMLSAAEQCGAGRLPNVSTVQSFEELLPGLSAFDCVLMGALEDPVQGLHEALNDFRQAGLRRIAMLIGPEGDFSEAETEALRRAGVQGVTFGPHILRTETAALFALSVLSYELIGSRDDSG
jgi:16S rRNA (uracil1498-N3)-methyltransferase